MRYRIITVLWIIFLILTNLYETEYLLPNAVTSESQAMAYIDQSFHSNDEVYFTIDNLPYYDDMEYFLTFENSQGQKLIYGNDKYYENLNYIPPSDEEYYGAGNIDGMQNLGKGPYLDLAKNIYYFNLKSLDDTSFLETTLNSGASLRYRSDDKEMMYNVDKMVINANKVNGKVLIPLSGSYGMSLDYNIFVFFINLFFFMLLILFLFVDISILSKEIAIKKSLGYPFENILYGNFKKQLVKSLIYFIPILIPVFLIFYDGSLQAYQFLFPSIYLIFKIYIISNIGYILSYTYVVRKIRIVDTLKGKINLKILNNISTFVNMCSKVVIILILTLSIFPVYQFVELGGQNKEYIQGNENYVNYNIDQHMYFEEGLDVETSEEDEIDKYLASKYEEYNKEGALLSSRTFFNNLGFYDVEGYEGNDNTDQVMITNTNYMKLIDFPMELSSSENYLLIPTSMKESTSEIEKDIKDQYGFETLEVKHYDKYPVYTYNPNSYPITRGYIYYPIILVVNNLEESTDNGYIVQCMYYRNDNPEYYESKNLTDSFRAYAKDITIRLIMVLIFGTFFMIAIIISSYYMINSHLEINGKEIAVKRILGYSNFKIYRQFYILDIICYVFFFIYIIIITLLVSIPWWFAFIYCLIMVLLNEGNRKMMIYKVEKNKIINKIKGEI